MRQAPPFILSQDISRGVLHAVQTTFNFIFMLSVMFVLFMFTTLLCSRAYRTFNAAFIIAVIVGLGVGETLFGRFAGHARQHSH